MCAIYMLVVTLRAKVNFHRVVRTIPADSDVVFLFCEIDCREGILRAVEKDRYDTLEDGIAAVVKIYVGTLTALVAELPAFRNRRAFVHPVIPVLDETRRIVTAFNARLRAAVEAEAPQLVWLDIFDAFVRGGDPRAARARVTLENATDRRGAGALRPEFELDGTHLAPWPAYVPLLAGSLLGGSGQ